MARSREGNGRHRQPWHLTICPFCGEEVEARRTLPDKPVAIKSHWVGDSFCPPLTAGRRVKNTVVVPPTRKPQEPAVAGQQSLFG